MHSPKYPMILLSIFSLLGSSMGFGRLNSFSHPIVRSGVRLREVEFRGIQRSNPDLKFRIAKNFHITLRVRSNNRDDVFDGDDDDEDFDYEYSEYYDDELIDVDYDDSLPGSTMRSDLDPDFGTVPLSEQLEGDDNFVFWCVALFLFTCFTHNMEDIASMGLQ